MSRPPAGSYIIRPKDAPGQALLTDLATTLPFPLPDLRVRVGNKHVTQWFLRNAENDTFIVSAGRNPNAYKWINKDESLFASVNQKGNEFRFESAGNGLWTIALFGQDLLLTFQDDQLTFKPADGSSAQRFELIHLLRD